MVGMSPWNASIGKNRPRVNLSGLNTRFHPGLPVGGWGLGANMRRLQIYRC
jgi:hypothetical protein